MNKTWIAIIVGSFIAIGVMVFLTIKGVSRREHTFIKWSAVDSFQEMGRASMHRMFPQINEDSEVTVLAKPATGTAYVEGFRRALQEQKMEQKVILADLETLQEGVVPPHIQIEMRTLDPGMSPGSCNDKGVERRQCLVFKALRKFHKKSRDRNRSWFLLQWMAHNQFILFFITPKPS